MSRSKKYRSKLPDRVKSLPVEELRARDAKFREIAAPPFDDELERFDECWSPYNDRPDGGYYDQLCYQQWCEHSDPKDYYWDPESARDDFEARQFFSNIASCPRIWGGWLNRAGIISDETGWTQQEPCLPIQTDERCIDLQLLQDYMEKIRRREWTAISTLIGNALTPAERAWGERTRHHHNIDSMVTLFAPFRVRPLDAWKGGSMRSLVEHAFVKWPVPEYLYDAWGCSMSDAVHENFQWQVWLIVLGQGGALHRLSKPFGWDIRRQNQQYLFDVPWSEFPEHSPATTVACLYSEILRLGGDIDVVRRICGNSAFVVNPLTRSADATFLSFWRETVGWLIEFGTKLTNADAQIILDWALHEFTENERAEQRRFTWKGRTPNSARMHAETYCREIYSFPNRANLHLRWNPRGWDWSLKNGDATWVISELTSGQELLSEGQHLNHCVGSYAGRCAAGCSAVFSLTRDGQQVLTIEVEPRSRQITQARGNRNRSATPDEMQIINRWRNESLANSRNS